MSPVLQLARPNPVALSDDDLMGKIAAGSADALGVLYDRYSARAFRVARSVCHDQGSAEHAVQEAFGSIFKSRLSCRSQRGTVAAWVLTLVLRRAIDVSRAEARQSTRRSSYDGHAIHSAADDAADQAGGRVDASRALLALAALPETQREVIVLAYYGGMTQTEIAERLGVPSRTVSDRIRLGMNNLTRDFGPLKSV